MSAPDPEETAVLEQFMERALVARVGIFLLSSYLLVVSFSWSGDQRFLMGATWAPISVPFFFAGLLGFPMVFWPRSRVGLLPWLTFLGVACVGRTFTVIFGDTYSTDERLRATGWITTWVLALVAVVQIQASEVLSRRGQEWTG